VTGLIGLAGEQELENSTFVRLIGALALMLLGSYLFAQGLSNLILLPLAVEIAGLSGAQAQAQIQILQNQTITQLAFGLICLISSLFVAFFKIETLKPRPPVSSAQVALPQLSKASLTTEELISELKLRTPRN